jgi:hypothetical protein
MPCKPYLKPAIETLDSSEVLDMIGPVQGYGAGLGGGGGAHGGIVSSPMGGLGNPAVPSVK